MKQFVPMTDEMLHQPDVMLGPLVPYRVGLNCFHGLSEQVVERKKENSENRERNSQEKKWEDYR